MCQVPGAKSERGLSNMEGLARLGEGGENATLRVVYEYGIDNVPSEG